MHHILHAQSYIHFRWFALTPRAPRALKRPQNLIFPTTLMLRVSFSPAPDCVDGDCWNRSFSTPTRHQEHRSCCFVVVFSSFFFRCLYFSTAEFLGGDYHYTTFIFHTTKVNIDIGTKILKAKFAGRKRHLFDTPQKFEPISI